MNYFNNLRATCSVQCHSFFLSLIVNALQTTPDEMVDWAEIDPVDLDHDDRYEEQPMLAKRLALPLFALLSHEDQLRYAQHAAVEIEGAYGVYTGTFLNDEEGEIVVYLSNYPVDVDVMRELFNDEEAEDAGIPSVGEIGAALAELTDDDVAFLNFVRATHGDTIFDDIAFDEDDESELREFIMGTDSADNLEISNACLEALRNEYDSQEEEEEEHEQESAALKPSLALVPQISNGTPEFEPEAEPVIAAETAPVIEPEAPTDFSDFEPEPLAPVATAALDDDAASDDFEAEQRNPVEDEEETAAQDAAMGAPDNAAEESFIDEQGQAVATALNGQPATPQAPAATPVVEEDSEHQRARFNNILEELASKLPVDTIAEQEDGALTVMMTRQQDGADRDYILRIRLARENFAGLRMFDVFYMEDDKGVQVLRATNAAAVLDKLAAL